MASPEPSFPEPDSSPVAGDSALQSRSLESLSRAVNYRAWLASFARPWLGPEPLEVGSGIGDYAEEWAGEGRRFTASEADPTRLAQLRERFAGNPHVDVRELRVPVQESASHSAVVAYNVLEHIDDDVGALRAFASLTATGGHIVLIVPAFPIAMSDYDREIGHFRRYRRRTLEAALRQAGLDVVVLHHVNAVGLLLWIVAMRLLGIRRNGDGAGLGLRVYDRLVPLLCRVESLRPPPFGQSLFAVARVPGEG